MPNADIEEVVGEYMKIMGGNVIESTLIDKVYNKKPTQNPKYVNLEEDDHEEENNVSSWQILENSIVDDVFQSENPYKERRIGVTKKKQDKQQWWKNISCPSCEVGFKSRSDVRKCHSCDKFIHRKVACTILCENETYFCLKCLPDRAKAKSKRRQLPQTLCCNLCSFNTNRKFNLERHVTVVHGGMRNETKNAAHNTEVTIPKARNKASLKNILTELKLEAFLESFEREGVDMEDILTMDENEIKDCLKEIGMTKFGDRHRFVIVVRREKEMNHPKEVDSNTNAEEIHILTNSDDDTERLLENSIESHSSNKSSPLNENSSGQLTQQLTLNCQLCSEATQHHCRICMKNVCILYCSIQDPNSDNESHRIHKKGDTRCKLAPRSHSSPVIISSDDSMDSESRTPVTELSLPAPANSPVKEFQDEFTADTSIDYDCILCKDPQPEDPVCNRCGQQLCLLCSAKDPDFESFNQRIHKCDDMRCYTSQKFECPCCDQTFSTSEQIETHMTNEHPVSDNSDIEEQMQPCLPNTEMLNSTLSDIGSELSDPSPVKIADKSKSPIVLSDDEVELPDISPPYRPQTSKRKRILVEDEEIKSPSQKLQRSQRSRIKQNLKNVSFLDDSMNDPDWQVSPSDKDQTNPFLKFITDESERLLNTRKKGAKKQISNNFTCDVCGAKLSRKDSLQRHMKLKH